MVQASTADAPRIAKRGTITTIEGIDLSVIEDDSSLDGSQRENLRNRWQHEVRYFAQATRRSRRLHYWLGVVSIVSAAFTGILAAVGASADASAVRWAAAVAGFVAAISTGLLTFFSPWENWKLRSMTLEDLKSEGRMFLGLFGTYKEFPDHGSAFKLFAANVEEIVRRHKRTFFSKQPHVPNVDSSPPDKRSLSKKGR